MQTTSAVWKSLWAAGNAHLEARATIAGVECAQMSSPVITRALTQEGLSIGNAVSASLQLSVLTADAVPRSAEVRVEMRLSDGEAASEWLPAGTFYISRRTRDAVTGLLTLECYDALLKANAEMPALMPWTTGTGAVMTTPAGEPLYFSAAWPRRMDALAADIALLLGVELDSRTALETGDAYVVEAPEAGATIRDVLGRIAAANGGNWIITPANRLRLVPVESADGAAEGGIDLAGVTGALDVRFAGAVTGIRYPSEDGDVLLGSAEGIVLDADVGAEIASDLYGRLAGAVYRAYGAAGAVYDPAAELGDRVRGGANGEIESALYGETATLGPAFRGDISAPEPGELADEYPYIGQGVRALTAAKVYAAELVESLDEGLDQEEIFNRLTDNGAAQGIYLQDRKLYINGTYIRAGEILATLIKGGTLTLGGANNASGVLQVLDAGGNVIGTWNKDGINVSKGTIAGPSVTIGGANNASGVLQVLGASGNVIGTWDNEGVELNRGSLSFPLNYGALTGVIELSKGAVPFRVQVTSTVSGTTNTHETRIDNFAMSITDLDTGDRMLLQPNVLSISQSGNPTALHGIYLNNNIDGQTQYSVYLAVPTDASSALRVYDRTANINTVRLTRTGDLTLRGNLTASGTKSRAVATDQYSQRLLYAYETPSPLFGDVGEGVIGEDGLCYVAIDAVFAQTITTSNYQVFLQKYGDGDCYIRERKPGWFVVAGMPGLAFGWEIKARQADFDQKRLERNDEPFAVPAQTCGADAKAYIDELMKGRVSA